MQREMGSFAGGRGRVNEPKVLDIVEKRSEKAKEKRSQLGL